MKDIKLLYLSDNPPNDTYSLKTTHKAIAFLHKTVKSR